VFNAKTRNPFTTDNIAPGIFRCIGNPVSRLVEVRPDQIGVDDSRKKGVFTYYLELAVRSLRRSPGLTALMMLAIGFGVAASMTTYSVFRGLSADPIPWKSSHLFVPQIDAWGPEHRENG
jgi:hypothetical protein